MDRQNDGLNDPVDCQRVTQNSGHQHHESKEHPRDYRASEWSDDERDPEHHSSGEKERHERENWIKDGQPFERWEKEHRRDSDGHRQNSHSDRDIDGIPKEGFHTPRLFPSETHLNVFPRIVSAKTAN